MRALFTQASKAIIAVSGSCMAFSLGAAIRAGITQSVPTDPTILEGLAYGWPVGLPAILVAAALYDWRARA